jgi:hypothetical protein
MSNIMYRIGRIYLHHRAPNDALKWFQLGQIAAQDSGSELAVAVLCGSEAWAYAMMGDNVLAEKLLDRSRDELMRANQDEAPDWARFYDDTEMYAITGTVHNELAGFDPRHADTAIPASSQALARFDYLMGRSRAFNLATLATSYLRQGDVDHGIQVGQKALMAATVVKSTRVTDRLEPLQIEAARRSNNPDARELSHLIRQHRSA